MIRAALAVPALVFALTVAPGVVLAQTAPTAPNAQPAGPAQPELTEDEIDAQGEAFGEAIEAMVEEMREAVETAGGVAQAKVQLDAIQARYQPAADAFADTLTKFIDQQVAVLPAEARAGMEQARGAVGIVRGAPGMARTQFEQAQTAGAAAGAAASGGAI
jgi:hypothetical protein